jgi:hypothetical protein
MWYEVCHMSYVLCCRYYVVCCMWYAVCMRYVVCGVLYEYVVYGSLCVERGKEQG